MVRKNKNALLTSYKPGALDIDNWLNVYPSCMRDDANYIPDNVREAVKEAKKQMTPAKRKGRKGGKKS